MKTKRLTVMLLALCMLLCMLPVGIRASAAEAEVVDTGACGDALYWDIYSDGVLKIYGTGDMDNYFYLPEEGMGSAWWCRYADRVSELIIEEGAASIGKMAFYEMYALTDATVAGSVTAVGASAFYGCSALDTVYFQGDAPAFAADAFQGVTATVRYTAGNATWTDDVMQDYGGTITWEACIPGAVDWGKCGENLIWSLDEEGVLTISGEGTMSENPGWGDSMTKVVIEEGVTSIAASAFEGCRSLAEITIADTVTSIGECAFRDCTALAAVSIPASVTEIGDLAFCNCTRLYGIWVDENNPAYCTGDYGVLFNKSMTRLIQAPGYRSGSYEIPAGVTEIGDGAFACHAGRTQIFIPDSVTRIGSGAFAHCTGLTKMVIPANVSTMGDQAFYSCTGLDAIIFRCDALEFGGETFYQVDGTAYYPQGNATWTEDALKNCGGTITMEAYDPSRIDWGVCGDNASWLLTDDGTLTISGTGDMYDVEYEGTSAWVCYAPIIKSIVVEEGITCIGSEAFDSLSQAAEVSIADTVTDIGYLAFSECDALVSVVIPDGVTRIGAGAFYQCSELVSVQIPDSVTEIEGDAFRSCKKLAEVELPPRLTVLGMGAFCGCNSITEMVIPESVSEIGDETFYGCDSLTSIRLPSTVKSIGSWAFFDCPKLESINFPEGLVSIGYESFTYSESLKEVVFPSTLEGISSMAFVESGLTKVTYTGSAPNIAMSAFGGVTADCYYPAGDETWTEDARQSYYGTLTWIPYTLLEQPDVTASNVASSGKVKLTWDAVDGAAQYKVYRATSLYGTWSLMKTTTSTSYTNTSAKAGTQYYYYVAAVDSKGISASKSDVVSRTCDVAQPVVKASNVASSGKIKLTWDAVDGAAKYEVYRSTTGKTGSWSLMKTTTSTSYTNTSAKAGTQYYYKVRALASKSAANSAYSEAVTRTCDLAQPVITLSNVASSGKIKVTWKAVDGAVSYKVYRSTTGKTGSWSLMKTTTGTSYTNTSAKAGTQYYYKVIAIHSKSAANSAYSVAKYRTCDLARPVVTIALKSGKPRLTWEAVDGAANYKVYRSTTGKDGSWSLMKTTTATSYTNTSAVAGNTYYYKVIATHTKSAANSAYSLVKSITAK